MFPALRQFKERALVPQHAIPEFDAAIASASRLRNSVLAEVVLIVLVYVGGILIVWRQFIALDASTWYATSAAGGSKLSFAGVWYGYVSLQIFQFLLARWYFRLFIWARLLRRISRIQLEIIPDPSNGATPGRSRLPLGVGHGARADRSRARRAARRSTFESHPAPRRQVARLQSRDRPRLTCCSSLSLMLGPLLVFCPQLSNAKRKGRLEYDALAQRYVPARVRREVVAEAARPRMKAFVGSGDIQSLADLGNSFELVRTMRVAPITKNSLLELGLATLLPVAPLLLTMIPLDEVAPEAARHGDLRRRGTATFPGNWERQRSPGN